MALAFRACAGLGVLGFWRPTDSVFRNKTRINQSGKVLKEQSILSPSFVLRRSRSMLLMCGETYFTRMWCVLGLAGG